MEIIRNNAEQANIILTEFKNSDVRLWSFSPTFNVIEIMLSLSNYEYCVFITMSNCLYFKGKLDSSKSFLKISIANEITEIYDMNSDFQIKLEGGFILKKGLYKDFFDEPNDLKKIPWET